MRRILMNLPLLGVLMALVVTSGCAHKPKPAPAAPTTPAPAETQQVPTPAPTPAATTAPAPDAAATTLKSEDLGTIYFDFDSANLSEQARGMLDHSAKLLRDHPGVHVLIEGDCDERGTAEYNQALGEKRAQAARDYLVAAGIAASRIDIISYGKEHPVDPGHDERAWSHNRRAAFSIKS
ncbi:MAG: peptidoglycan-associated lipoprotein Pal [Candidatus Eiseniibacteriota bacterium]